MARIRSIKPEFFTSETIASLPISARLTFIGLWTYVDDNGVGLDNHRLINAAIWPLDEDPHEALTRTHEDLMSLHEARLITRYEHSGKRYLCVNGWNEHQKVQHPRKARYPAPTDTPEPPPTRQNANPHEDLVRTPEDPWRALEVLTPEQGAGSREQGAGSRDIAPRKRATQGTRIPDDFTLTDDMKAWAKEHTPDAIVATETAQFLDHWRAKSGKDAAKADWVAAWRNWMRNSQKWTTERASPKPGNGLALAAANGRAVARPSVETNRMTVAAEISARYAAQGD